MQIIVDNMADFRRCWNGLQNFLIHANFFRLKMELPSKEDIVDVLRRDGAAKVSIKGDMSEVARRDLEDRFRREPLDEVLDYPFTLSHFDLAAFYGSGQFLQHFQEKIMTPWRTFLASSGLTWQRCYPIIFVSGKGCSTGYHVDVSHVLAWQIYGKKMFNGFLEPQQYAPIDQCVNQRDRIQGQMPRYQAEHILSYPMAPGDLLWNQILTPHWVTAGDEIAVSVNISHGGVRAGGEFCANEQFLRQRWDRHPEEAWLSDLRY